MSRILIVDDDGETCRFMTELLGRPDREIRTTQQVAEALTLARQPFDLLISDINLDAQQTGMDVLRESIEVLAAICDARLGRDRGALRFGGRAAGGRPSASWLPNLGRDRGPGIGRGAIDRAIAWRARGNITRIVTDARCDRRASPLKMSSF